MDRNGNASTPGAGVRVGPRSWIQRSAGTLSEGPRPFPCPPDGPPHFCSDAGPPMQVRAELLNHDNCPRFPADFEFSRHALQARMPPAWWQQRTPPSSRSVKSPNIPEEFTPSVARLRSRPQALPRNCKMAVGTKTFPGVCPRSFDKPDPRPLRQPLSMASSVDGEGFYEESENSPLAPPRWKAAGRVCLKQPAGDSFRRVRARLADLAQRQHLALQMLPICFVHVSDAACSSRFLSQSDLGRIYAFRSPSAPKEAGRQLITVSAK